MKPGRQTIMQTVIVASLLWLVAAPSVCPAGSVKASYLYKLSNFSGPVPYQCATVFLDRKTDDIFVIDSEHAVTVFNGTGMEIYRFGDGGALGVITDGAVDDDGNILLLSKRVVGPNAANHSILRCNFRGDLLARIDLENLPTGFSGFGPDRLVFKDGRLYLAEMGAMKVAVIDDSGRFIRGYDLIELFDEDERKKLDTGMFGFCVDNQGNLLFTVPGFFKAFRLSPDGKLARFGSSGSGPGKFGIISGIAADDRGLYYVSDRLRSVVIVFDSDLRFQAEFGYFGYRDSNLIAPAGVEVSGDGEVYVAQAGRRGVSVFRIHQD